MELREYAGILCKNWILVVVATILGVALGAGISLLMSPKYEATTQVYVATRAGEGSTVELVQGADYSRQMINSYVDIIETGVVLERVVDQLNLDVPAHELAEYVGADAPEDSSLINIVAESTSPEQAALIANTVRESFDEVLTNQLELTDPVAGSPVSLTTTQVALVPEEPISPNVLLNLVLGLLGGLAVGVAAAIIRGAFDTRIHNVRDVQSLTDVPVIGGIYEMKDASEQGLIVHSRAHSPRAESYRTLRTNLQFLNVDSSRKVFVFTSSNPNEGKTTTALNLAMALAQAGEKVVVVEGDLRKPAFASYLDIEGGAGLTDVLIGRVSADDVLQRWGSDELFVLAAGRTPPNPSELLGSQAMKDTVDWLEAEFDYVIIDAPPTLAVSDAALLGSLALGVVVVVASGSTKKHELEETLESLDTSGTPILGVVATMLPLGRGPNRYYEYGYGDGGKRSARVREKVKHDGD